MFNKDIKGENKIKYGQKGDENMEMIKTNALDVNFILTHGTAISSQEALSDINPINWSEDVLDGKYRNQIIIKAKEEKWDV